MVKLLSSGVIFISTLVFCQAVDSLKVDELLTKSVESKVVEISATISYDSFEPRAFKLSLFPRKSPSEVYISRMFFPGDSIQIILPYNILSEDTLGNIASVEPIGGSYEKLYRLFTKSEEKIDLITGTFPAGTLSGAPKYKALELIDLYEKKSREFYGGAIGYMGFNGDFNHAIIIRSFLSKNKTLYYQAGAGIVAKSNAENENQEVYNKVEALRKSLIMAEKL